MTLAKLKLGELPQIYNALAELAKEKMPTTASYKIAKLLKTIEREFAIFEEQRMKLLDKYADKDETGKFIITDNKYQFTKNGRERFDAEFEELSNLEIEVDFTPIAVNEFENAQISPIVLAVLDKFVIGF